MAQFSIHGDAPDLSPRYNIAPTQPVNVVLTEHDSQRRAVQLRWGLIPSWTKPDAARGTGHINARAESLANKPTFAASLQRRRCIILATGFYEWQARGAGAKQPHYIYLQDGRPFALAGIYDRWRREDAPASEIRSCAIITTRPNALVAQLHDRMPVILDGSALDQWLDREQRDRDALSELLAPFPEQHMALHPVALLVNHVAADDPACVAPLPAGEAAEHWEQQQLGL